ncbi:3-phosphoshikimate 1-carboxyvinyltransferase 1 [Aeromicrobium flavum]|uniref:3-phosphoshikimate 1-carboxyvinyltransferase n=1 Tax=Aeromicrobium flavum TaxID=416568 RepID=A0A512HUV3_9ACTN|nr:3-phosphoshikimate 1-carboxyvinyltransferase [Aeromicrobium flavum]GEO89211.1 3-phosphoshikimate 1-carboxyvinyltransferase 1 [Aeromicrobium flavum]
MTVDWHAPRREHPADVDVLLPGSKSQTNRALVLAAIADGPSSIHLPLAARDTELMAAALVSLGARIDRDGDTWTVTPITPVEAAEVDCGLAGTVMRFVPPVAALGAGTVRFDGDPRARERPMGTTISSLRDLGVRIDDEGTASLPFTLHGTGAVRGGALTVDASASSQFVSALLLVAPRFAEGLDLRHAGGPLPSLPHVAMTVTELRRRGVVVDVSDGRWQVHPGPVKALDVTIEPDLSNAGPFVAAALATAGRARVRHWPEQTDQAGDAWRDLAVAFGGQVARDGADLVVTGPERLRGVDLDLHDVGELTPVVAALAALADGPSTLTGIEHLRGHETDRLTALATEITRLGGNVVERTDGLVITPAPLHGGAFATYDDHRMAHAAAVLGLRVDDLVVENIGTTAKTYPAFADDWERSVS